MRHLVAVWLSIFWCETVQAVMPDDGIEAGTRVMVLQWPSSQVDHRDPRLQRNVRARISKRNARFYPGADLYQSGRRERRDGARPYDQRAVVPDAAIAEVMAAVHELLATPPGALDAEEWGQRASQLRQLVTEQIWFVDRHDLRLPLFRAYVEIGHAANNTNNEIPPFFERIHGVDVNYYTYLAATMAVREPALLASLPDPTRHAEVMHLVNQLDNGAIQQTVLHFETHGHFDMHQFATDYTLYINGLEEQITNEGGLVGAALGVAHVSLRRRDGYGLSARVETLRDDEEFWGIRNSARKRMEVDFSDQLMRDPDRTQPELDEWIVTNLAIYQGLHPGQEITIAVPVRGSRRRVLLWKWQKDEGRLTRMPKTQRSKAAETPQP